MKTKTHTKYFKIAAIGAVILIIIATAYYFARPFIPSKPIDSYAVYHRQNWAVTESEAQLIKFDDMNCTFRPENKNYTYTLPWQDVTLWHANTKPNSKPLNYKFDILLQNGNKITGNCSEPEETKNPDFIIIKTSKVTYYVHAENINLTKVS